MGMESPKAQGKELRSKVPQCTSARAQTEPIKASLDEYRHTWAPTAIYPDTTRNLSLSTTLFPYYLYTVRLCTSF